MPTSATEGKKVEFRVLAMYYYRQKSRGGAQSVVLSLRTAAFRTRSIRTALSYCGLTKSMTDQIVFLVVEAM